MELYAGAGCWNEDAAGGACIGCGCCSEDPEERYEARIDVLKDRIFNIEREMRSSHKEFDFERDAWVRALYDYETPESLIDKYREQINYCRDRLRMIREKRRELAMPA